MERSKVTHLSVWLVLFGSTIASAQARISLPDSGLVYSMDSSVVAFVKSTPGRLVPTGQESVEATELWIAKRDGSKPHRLVTGHPAKDMRFVLAGLHSPAFSVDGDRVFFLSDAWVTSDALHVVSVKTLKEHYVAPANSLEVVRGGRYQSCLLVEQHRYWMAGGSFDWLWLIAEFGRDIGPVADTDSEDFDSRLAEWRRVFAVSDQPKRNIRCPGTS